MSQEAIYLYDSRIPSLEKKDGDGTIRLRFNIPTKVIETLGKGELKVTDSGITVSALAIARKCVVTRGHMHDTEDPQDGILLDGGITIVDETGETRTLGKRIWTLADAGTESVTPDEILKYTVMGKGGDFASRIKQILAGYRIQEEESQRRISNKLRQARGDTLESAYGTFGWRG